MRLPFSLDRPLVFFDLETTGLSVSRDRIVELAVIRLTPGGDVFERVRRFNPGIPIPAGATAVHGISDADVAGEPTFARVARSLAELLAGCDLAGFNVRRFDLPMLIHEFRRAGVPFELEGRRVIDIQAIFHREEKRDLSAAARFYLGREHPEAHSALGDIRTSAAVLAAQMARYGHIPRDLQGLHAYCDEYLPIETELERWFEDVGGGERVFRRGKHRGRKLSDVAAQESDYLTWMLGTDDLDDAVREVVRASLRAYAPDDVPEEAPPDAAPEGSAPPG